MSGTQNPRGLPSRDWCTLEQALYLAKLIEGYWKAKGRQIKTEVISTVAEGIGGVKCSGTVYSIRSNMVDGLPPKDTSQAIRVWTGVRR